MRIMAVGLGAGAGFGAATSLVNALSSPYADIGAPLTGTVWAGAAKVLSLLMDAGWSWAALAVLVGAAARTPLQGALVGAVSLVAATGAYYATDSLVADAGGGLVVWCVAALLFGSVLGAVGASTRRRGVAGLVASLTVPVGAALQMVVLPPGPALLPLSPPAVLARTVVWVAAALGAAWALHRYWTEQRSGRRAE
ncbi:hypothetical protein ABZ883_11795 [Streptomyces sp. NPDC046977]|uniref:hypothetical protein n=1 Tax=Streptomyces sp. NPDC046977 TaxID=3154703 RepID=UPI0034095277